MELLSVKEVAKNLNVSAYTAAEWIRAGKIKAYKVGRLWRVDQGELQKFVNGGKKGRKSP